MATLVYIGRPQGSAVTDTGTLGQDEMRASTMNKTIVADHVWLRRIGARIGSYSGGSKDYRLVAYAASSANVPTSRRALVGLHSISTVMTSATEGAYVEWDIDTADDSPTNLAAAVSSGTRIALAIEHDSAGTLAHGMVQRASGSFPPGQDDQFRDKTGVAVPPTTFGSYTPHTEGVMAIYAVCHVNVKPHEPVNRSISNVETLTPVFEFDFRDDNGDFGGADDSGDYMRTYRIQVRDASSGDLIWNPAPFTASSGERSANHATRTYAGITLVRGNEVEWRALATDHFGASSDWSSWLSFTPSTAGTVTAGPTPTGKQNTFTPGPFTGKWTHATGLAMTHANVFIEYHGRVYLDTGMVNVTDVASSAPPGTTFSIPYATMTPSALLPGDYQWYMVGRDSAGFDSQPSNKIAFSVDKPPSTPTSLQPYGQVYTTYPLITLVSSDEDDTSGTGHIVKVEIMNAAGTVLQTRTMTNTSGDTWRYQTVAADVPAFGTYRYRAYSFDGFLYSGGTTVEASAQRSYEGSFIYADGPDLTIVSPLEGATLPNGAPTFQWTAPTQTQFKLRLYDASDGFLLYRTNGGNWASSSQQSYTIAPGYIHNAGVYRWEIEVADSVGLTAVLSAGFDAVYTPPADVAGFQVTPQSIFTDPWPTALRGDWEPSLEPNFVAYLIYRDDITAITGEPLFYFTSVTDTAFLDFHPASGIDYTYTIKVLVDVDIEQVISLGVSAEGRIDLQGTVLSSVLQPTTVRAVLTSVQERTRTRQGTESTYKRWGDTAPSTIRGRGRWWEVTTVARIFGDAVADAAQRIAEIMNLDGIDHTFCERTERIGDKRFVKIPSDGGLVIGDQRFGRADLTITTRDEAYQEGLEVVQ